jgi:hypothetical protein
MYWERQRGDNCRIHSLNAFFGKKLITEALFNKYCKEYDTIIWGLNSSQMDGFAECRNIVSYIVDKYTNQFCALVPINLRGVHNKHRQLWEYERFLQFFKKGFINAYFEFNKDHIWLNKYYNGKWYKIDSLSGVLEINKPNHFTENGYLLVFEPTLIFYEIEYLLNKIDNLISENNVVVKGGINSINTSVINENSNHLDTIEIAINNLYHLMTKIQFNFDKHDKLYNEKLSLLKTIFKIAKQLIMENRKEKIKSQIKIKFFNELVISAKHFSSL